MSYDFFASDNNGTISLLAVSFKPPKMENLKFVSFHQLPKL